MVMFITSSFHFRGWLVCDTLFKGREKRKIYVEERAETINFCMTRRMIGSQRNHGFLSVCVAS